MSRPWKRLSTDEGDSLRIFQLTRERFESPRTGKPVDAVVLRVPDWVNVVALTPEREVVLIRQFRFGTAEVTLEIPGGLVDADETARAAAERELLEETGYAARRWTALGSIDPNPAFLRNRLHTFLAEDCVRAADPRLDPGEDIEVELRPLAEIDGLLASGEIRHALVAVAFQKLDFHARGVPLAAR